MKNIKLIALLVCLTVVVCSFAGCDISSVPVIGGLFVKTAPLSLDTVGGEFSADAVIPESYSDNAELVLPTPSLQYYEFLGWSFNEDGSDPFDKLPAKMELTEEQIELGIVLYAVWNRLSANISYDLAGGEWAEGDVADTTYYYGEELELLEPEREFFEFDGWSFNGEIIDTIPESQEGDVALVATWTQVETQIFFVFGDVENPSLPDAGNTFATDEDLDLGDAEYIPTADGYLFSGWYLDAELTVPVSVIDAGTTDPVTVYAKWEPTPTIEGDHWVGAK